MTRISPHDLDTERALLGWLIYRPEEIDAVSGVMQATDFYRPDHAALYLLIREMRDRGEVVDLVSVSERVNRGGRDQEYGGLAYVLHIGAEGSGPALHRARVIADHATRRRLLRALHEATERAYDATIEPAELLRQVQADARALEGGGTDAEEFATADELAADLARAIADAEAGRAPPPGTPVPYSALSTMLPVIPYGEVTVVAGRPGSGKSRIGMELAHAAALDSIGTGEVVVYSLEMDHRTLAAREVARAARQSAAHAAEVSLPRVRGLTTQRLLAGSVDASDRPHLTGALDELAALPLRVYRRQSVTLPQLIASMGRAVRGAAHRERRLRLVVVDYLQLIGIERAKGATEAEGIARAMRELKVFAVENMVAVVLLSQLNRQSVSSADAMELPRLSHLLGSDSIGATAGAVILAHRPVVIDKKKPEDLAFLVLDKNRFGPPGVAEMRWDGASGAFLDPGEVW